MDLDYYDVDLVPGDRFEVEGAYLGKYGKPDIKADHDTLVVEDIPHSGIHLDINLLGLSFHDDQPKIKIYYPENTELKNIAIRCGASDLDFVGLTAESAEFNLDFGKLSLADITADNITIEMDSGDCTMEGIKAAGTLTVSNDFGKTTLDGTVADQNCCLNIVKYGIFIIACCIKPDSAAGRSEYHTSSFCVNAGCD